MIVLYEKRAKEYTKKRADLEDRMEGLKEDLAGSTEEGRVLKAQGQRQLLKEDLDKLTLDLEQAKEHIELGEKELALLLNRAYGLMEGFSESLVEAINYCCTNLTDMYPGNSPDKKDLLKAKLEEVCSTDTTFVKNFEKAYNSGSRDSNLRAQLRLIIRK